MGDEKEIVNLDTIYSMDYKKMVVNIDTIYRMGDEKKVRKVAVPLVIRPAGTAYS